MIDLLAKTRCPICLQPWKYTGSTFRCDNHHSFDMAKEGYLHLMPVQQKNSKKPGDDISMITARRRWLEAGYYDPLVSELESIIRSIDPIYCLDVGCGEGYYLRRLCDHKPDMEAYGVDISKAAVRLAAKSHFSGGYLVSAVKSLPFQDHFFSIVLSIFAPREGKELRRILSHPGKLITVNAGRHHLRELKQQLYEEIKPNPDPDRQLKASFELEASRSLQFTRSDLGEEDWGNLIAMTPYVWKSKPIDLQIPQSLTFDFLIQVYRIKQQ